MRDLAREKAIGEILAEVADMKYADLHDKVVGIFGGGSICDPVSGMIVRGAIRLAPEGRLAHAGVDSEMEVLCNMLPEDGEHETARPFSELVAATGESGEFAASALTALLREGRVWITPDGEWARNCG